MKSFLDIIFFRTNNLDQISKSVKKLSQNSPANKIFDAINSFTSESEIRYVGGCIRKIINEEKVDDIDMATNLEPIQVCEALKKKDINYYETGIEHGTVTAIIEKFKFEITSLREDISTDGRHAKVRFSKDWIKDASRRDFTINSIYSDIDGNLFDPFDGKNDLKKGSIKFIGDIDKRIKEDYLRIIRYIRFFLNYSKQPHDPLVIKKLKINIGGVSNISKDRLLDELRKIVNLETLKKLSKDHTCHDLILLIFPEFKKIRIFSKLNSDQKNILKKTDLIFVLSLLDIDKTDNTDYFLYKYNISKKDQKRIKIIDEFYKEKVNSKTFLEKNMNKLFYYNGKQAVLDIINFKIINSKKSEKKLDDLYQLYANKNKPVMPIKADVLMTKYKIPEGKQLGLKLKDIEKEWVRNNFKISDQQVDFIITTKRI